MFGPKTQKRIVDATRKVEQNPLYASYLNEVMQHVDYIQDNSETIGVIIGSETDPGANGTHVYEATWVQYEFDTDEWVIPDEDETTCYVIDVNGGELIFGRRYIALRCAYDATNNEYYFVVDNGLSPDEGSTGYTAVDVVTKLCIVREYNDEDPPVLLCVTDITYETRSILIPTDQVGDVVCGPYEDIGCCEDAPTSSLVGIWDDPEDVVGCALDDVEFELELVSVNLLATAWEGPATICDCTGTMRLEFDHHQGESTGWLWLNYISTGCNIGYNEIDPFTWNGTDPIDETFTGVMVNIGGTSYGPVSIRVMTV